MSRNSRAAARAAICSAFVLVALSTVLLAGEPISSDSSDIEQLDWMVGHWRGVDGDAISEEWWTAAGGDLMLGLHRDVGPDGSSFFEYLRITVGEKGLEYWAQPMGRQGTRFSGVDIGAGYVVFENPSHDFPKRISYARDEEGRLVARIEGAPGESERVSEWRWTRVDE